MMNVCMSVCMIYYSRKCQSTFIIEKMECENALFKHVD